MEFSRELIEKAMTAGSAQELFELAKAENIEMTEIQAERAYDELNRVGELADEELDNVAGGCGDPGSSGSGDTPKYKVGDKVYYFIQCPSPAGLPTRRRVDAVVIEVRDKEYGYFYYKVTGDMVIAEYRLHA